jgi:hypothetical protein
MPALPAVSSATLVVGASPRPADCCANMQDAGRFGVYAGDAIRDRGKRGWWGSMWGWTGAGCGAPITVASFPLAGTLTAAHLAAHPQQGPVLRQLLRQGAVDERDAVVLHLAVERARLRQAGPAGGGELAWLALLPTSFTTTLYFSELDMQWLRGTTLYTATR